MSIEHTPQTKLQISLSFPRAPLVFIHYSQFVYIEILFASCFLMGNFRIILGSHMILAVGNSFRFRLRRKELKLQNGPGSCWGSSRKKHQKKKWFVEGIVIQIYSWGLRLKIKCLGLQDAHLYDTHWRLHHVHCKFNSLQHRFWPSRSFYLRQEFV